jgi:hypothetical protein
MATRKVAHKNKVTWIGTIIDDPRYAAGTKQASLRMLMSVAIDHPEKKNKEGSGPLLLPAYMPIRVWGDLATQFGAGKNELKMGDIVELEGRIAIEPLYKAKAGDPPAPPHAVIMVDEVDGHLAKLGQVDDDEYQRIKTKADERNSKRNGNGQHANGHDDVAPAPAPAARPTASSRRTGSEARR